ncbi:hypothetical protein VNO78_04680 [Psophocarpus tetragonolobus]|uniref:Uncharacterized protein n=1 Tax=Psophocarpus tetragonolobus TaxID=3891 RepID=A0AAN9XWE6_PSOTE
MAAPSADLGKIGAEGFALIDKFYGPPRRNSNGNDAFHGRRERCWVVFQVPNNDVMEESAFIGMEAPSHFAATSAVNYVKPPKPAFVAFARTMANAKKLQWKPESYRVACVKMILALDVGAKGNFAKGVGMAVVDSVDNFLPVLLLEFL